MARIAGVDLPRQKRVEVALTYIYGIGHTRSGKILGKAGIEPNVRVKDLSEEEVSYILESSRARILFVDAQHAELGSTAAASASQGPFRVHAPQRRRRRLHL